MLDMFITVCILDSHLKTEEKRKQRKLIDKIGGGNIGIGGYSNGQVVKGVNSCNPRG